MASCKVNEPASDAKHLSSACEQLSISVPDPAAGEPQSDTMNATLKPQTSGKLRRTALRFFGVRKSICILPTLFGGRSKNLNKWSSKKGIGKSKTHDGLSKASYDDNLGSGYTPAGDFEYPNQKDTAGHKSPHTDLSGDQKSLSLPRPKKGLRGLFHSIKHHKNHRNVESEKNEMIAMSSQICNKEEPIVQDNANQNVTECLEKPNVPDLANVICGVTIAPECNDVDVMASEDSMVEQGSFKSSLDNQMKEMEMVAVASNRCSESSRANSESCLQIQLTPEPTGKSRLPVGSSDQLNLIFGDVASLKSFDSLTGCGDIIADQDDDSIAESTVSGERIRNGGKRSSCYVTYQGGGEEMASPDELDGDGIRDLWSKDAQEEICRTCVQSNAGNLMTVEELSSSHHMDLMSGNSALRNIDSSPSYADVLTPQSENQESVPNSDEGYYDSTTPGANEEGHEQVDRVRTDRLPRDSYSGDALYELFGPDDNLVSPPYENQSKLPNAEPSEYLDESVDVKKYSAFVPETDQLQMVGAELYRAHVTFLSADLQSMCSRSKELAPFTNSLQDKGLNEINKPNSKPLASSNKNSVKPEEFVENGNMVYGLLVPKENQRRVKPLSAQSEKRHSNISFESTSDPDLGSFASETHCESKQESSIDALSTISNDSDDGQMVCFSQALVDFTKHSHLFSNSHDGVDGLEGNSSFAQNMQALPPIVTFDVVDMHNEGEYDQQIHVEMEDDLTSPYQQFEESYLQKDTMAECDYQMLDLHEQSLFSKTWAIASLPRHLSLTRGNQSMPSPLSLNRRSRSLDTESLELKMTDGYFGNRAAIVSCPQTERDLKRESSLHPRKNGHMSTSEIGDNSSILSLSWQTETERTSSPPLTDRKITEKTHSLCQTQVKHTVSSGSSSSHVHNSKSQLLSNIISERVSCNFASHNTGLFNAPCHLPLQSGAFLPHSSFVFSGIMGEDLFVRKVSKSDVENEGIFYTATVNSQSNSQHSKNRPVGITQGMPHSGSPSNHGASKDEKGFISEARKSLACNKFFPEATPN